MAKEVREIGQTKEVRDVTRGIGEPKPIKDGILNTTLMPLARQRAKKRLMRNVTFGFVLLFVWLFYTNHVTDWLARLLVGRDVIRALEDDLLLLSELHFIRWRVIGLVIGFLVCIYNKKRGQEGAHFQIRYLSLSKTVAFVIAGVVLACFGNLIAMRICWQCSRLPIGYALSTACFMEFVLESIGWMTMTLISEAFCLVPFEVLEREEKAKLGICE